MTLTRIAGGFSSGLFGGKHLQRRSIKSVIKARERCYFGVINRREQSCNHVVKRCGSISSQHASDFVEINSFSPEERSKTINGGAFREEIL